MSEYAEGLKPLTASSIRRFLLRRRLPERNVHLSVAVRSLREGVLWLRPEGIRVCGSRSFALSAPTCSPCSPCAAPAPAKKSTCRSMICWSFSCSSGTMQFSFAIVPNQFPRLFKFLPFLTVFFCLFFLALYSPKKSLKHRATMSQK